MSGTENMKADLSLLEVIRMLAFHGETGRLEIRAAATSGTFSFQYGKLVDAQMDSLKGFQAVNAAVSLRDAHFSFDPSLPPLCVNPFSINERAVLKRFFGIETAETLAMDEVPTNEVDWNVTPAQVVPLSEVAELNANDSGVVPNIESPQEPVFMSDQVPKVSEQIVGNDADDRTSRVVRDTVPYAVLPTSAARNRFPMYIMILLLLTAAGAFALVWKFGERRQPTLVAASSESASLPAAEPKSDPSLPASELQVSKPEPETSSTHDLTGEWRIVNTVHTTRYRPFNNLEIGFRLVISQTGKEFTAKGEKISENGQALPPGGRTPIHVTGLIKGDSVQATFYEQGSVRKTNGRFVWRIQNSGAGLKGTFASTAAGSRGTSAATKAL